MTPLLEGRDLRYRHSEGLADAVAGASISVRGGEMVGVIGPNAAGKSTLARLCCGLLPADAGAVILQGAEMGRLSRRERARRVTFLPQNPPHDLSFTAREVALMGRAPHLGLWSLEGPHDLALAGAACDRLLLMDRGRLVADGVPAEVLRPAILEPVYGTVIEVVPNPATGQPLVAPRISR